MNHLLGEGGAGTVSQFPGNSVEPTGIQNSLQQNRFLGQLIDYITVVMLRCFQKTKILDLAILTVVVSDAQFTLLTADSEKQFRLPI